jgi:FixJ family two-component response regulator
MNTSTVFVIDDQASVRHALCEMLSAFGYNVEAHESADSFLRAFDPLRNGCVVADVRMPGIDGIELVRELGPPSSAARRAHLRACGRANGRGCDQGRRRGLY